MKKESKKIILIGGAPTMGKSTLASILSKRLDIPWISTDQFREIMKTVARREDSPEIFSSDGYTAEKFLAEFSAEEIVTKEMEQGREVWKGVKRFIDKDYVWEYGFIIEGVHILPHLVKKDFTGNEDVKSVFLVDEDADRIRKVVFTRGLWDDAETYADDVKEKEVEWASLFSHKVKAEAEECGLPCIETKKDDDDVNSVMEALGIVR